MADKQYDVSPTELRATEERAAIRKQLKWEFRRQLENPNSLKGEGGYLVRISETE